MDKQRWSEANPQTNSGQYAIMLGAAVRQRNSHQLQEVIRVIALNCSDAEAKWIFKTTRQDLPEDLRLWMDSAIDQIRSSFDDE